MQIAGKRIIKLVAFTRENDEEKAKCVTRLSSVVVVVVVVVDYCCVVVKYDTSSSTE